VGLSEFVYAGCKLLLQLQQCQPQGRKQENYCGDPVLTVGATFNVQSQSKIYAAW